MGTLLPSLATPVLLKPFFGGLLGMDVEQFNAMSGGIVVGIMIMPMVSLAHRRRPPPRSQEPPRGGLRRLGATKYDVSTKVVVPAAFSGIVAAFLLAISAGDRRGRWPWRSPAATGTEMGLNPLKSMRGP